MHPRVFKTKPFAKLAGNLALADSALCAAAREMIAGLVDANLGGGVLKKRIAGRGKGKSGGFRTIVATNFRSRWVFMYVFGKDDRDSIDARELAAFRKLAGVYAVADVRAIKAAIAVGELLEICHAEN
jgi:hypothetical protein